MALFLSGPLVSSALSPTWIDGSGWLASCHKTTRVFDIPICLSSAAFAESASKYNHVANVLAQLIDNDADGEPDDAAVHAKMVSDKFFMVVPATEDDFENMPEINEGRGQMTGLWEAVPNSCDTPTN